MLPEYHLTSWCPEKAGFVSASRESFAYLAKYQALARDLDINIVPGTICHPPQPQSSPSAEDADGQHDGEKEEEEEPSVEVPGGGDAAPVELCNMAYFLAAGTGEVLGSYQKKNLWHPERGHLAAGRAPPHTAFEVPTLPPIVAGGPDDKGAGGKTVKVGLLVCWDLAFPEAFKALVAQGADLIVVPSYWYMTDVDEAARRFNPECERLFLSNALVTRAYENTAAVVFCNAGGLSQVAVPILGALGAFGTAEETKERGESELRVVEVDMEVLRTAEENYKIREDMAKEAWHYGYAVPSQEQKQRNAEGYPLDG